jgi:hypothetical protein
MFSMPGKINHIKTASLDIHLETGHMVDFKEWVPSVQKCIVKIMLNDTVLHHGDIGSQIKITHEFLDLDAGVYDLQIEIEEIAHGFDCNGLWAAPVLHIQGIWIENLNLGLAFEEYGKCHYATHPDITTPSNFMGNIGVQSLQFTTPIYTWLLSNDNYEDATYYSPVLLNTV